MLFRSAGVRLYSSSFEFAQPCVFVKQLPGPILCASHYCEDPLSRSYGVNLPSSLTVNLPSALVYSTRLRVSVCGTGTIRICLADFLGSLITLAISPSRRRRRTIRFGSQCGFACTDRLLHPSTDYSVSPRRFHCSVSTSLLMVVTEC